MEYIRVKKANCKNCYKCLKYCPVKSISYIDDQVDVLAEQCILCGRCINICPQKAKTVVNDVSQLTEWLADPSVRVVASLAPSYVGVYGEQNGRRLVTALKQWGFDAVEETAIGAQTVTESYRRLMDEGRMKTILSTCCPTVNMLITRYYPALIPSMAPVVSPVLAHGRMIKERMGSDTKVVFIGPCLSKIKEIHDHPESVDGVISFRMLENLLTDSGLVLEELSEESPSSPVTYSRIYPVPEGIVRDVQHQGTKNEPHDVQNDYEMMSVCGIQNVMTFLDELGNDECESRNECGKLFVELNACDGGCVNGPLISEERRAAYHGQLEINRYVKKSQNGLLSGLQPDAVVTCPSLSQEFHSEQRKSELPNEETIRRILTKIGKPTPDKELNCGSCGYNTCRDKAIAVYQKKAELYMCLPYMNDLSQSLSNVTLSVSPNMIIAVDQNLRIIEMNLTAQKQFDISRAQAVQSDLFEYMDPADFEEVFQTHRNIIEKKVRLQPLNIITQQTLIYLPEQNLVMGFIKDITDEEQQKEKAYRARLESAEMAQKVIEKQMIAAQEIASLLGETTAETKVTLDHLKGLILREGES